MKLIIVGEGASDALELNYNRHDESSFISLNAAIESASNVPDDKATEALTTTITHK
jgi:hypothetical protein